MTKQGLGAIIASLVNFVTEAVGAFSMDTDF
jgi:hypothetical protein